MMPLKNSAAMSLSKDQNPFKMCKICEEVTTMIVHKIIKDCLAALGLKQNKKKKTNINIIFFVLKQDLTAHW